MGSPKLIDLPRAPEAIELRHLRAFVAVAEELNFSRAATRMFVTQPALSRQIQALERLLGVDLLRRSTQRVELTIAGESLLDRSRSLLSDVDEAVQATRSVAGRLDAEVVRLAQPLADTLATGGLDAFREAYEAMNAQLPSPSEIQARPVNAGGTPSLVYGAPGADGPTVLYLHGGGYVVGSAFGYRPLAGTVAALSGASVLVPDYRLAPEHTYPAALDDVAAAYDWLLGRVRRPADIAFVGDSSGAGLTMGLLLRLRDRGQRPPGPGGAAEPLGGHAPAHAGGDRAAAPSRRSWSRSRRSTAASTSTATPRTTRWSTRCAPTCRGCRRSWPRRPPATGSRARRARWSSGCARTAARRIWSCTR